MKILVRSQRQPVAASIASVQIAVVVTALAMFVGVEVAIA